MTPQGKEVIACQGIPGAYSQITARHLFPEGTFLYFKNFRAVARAVNEGMCDYGVLPIENNTYGSVKEVYKVIGEEDIRIVRGFTLKIEHVLLAKPGVAVGEITEVSSHEQALGQCSEFLHSLGDKVRIRPSLNTAVAARSVAESPDPYVSAISSPECASLYGLEVVKRRIADNPYNYTRFICVARDGDCLPGASRISVVLTLPHRPGSLAEVLSEISARGINLIRIESTPIPGKDFEFRFYIDFEASLRDEKTMELILKMKSMCPEFRLLGNYTEET